MSYSTIYILPLTVSVCYTYWFESGCGIHCHAGLQCPPVCTHQYCSKRANRAKVCSLWVLQEHGALWTLTGGRHVIPQFFLYIMLYSVRYIISLTVLHTLYAHYWNAVLLCVICGYLYHLKTYIIVHILNRIVHGYYCMTGTYMYVRISPWSCMCICILKSVYTITM